MADNPRLTYLEGRVEEQAQNWERLSTQIGRVDETVDSFRNELSARMGGLDQKVDAFRAELSAGIDALDKKVDEKIDGLRVEMSSQITALDLKMTSQFKWLVGITVTMWAVTVSVILVGIERLLVR